MLGAGPSALLPISRHYLTVISTFAIISASTSRAIVRTLPRLSPSPMPKSNRQLKVKIDNPISGIGLTSENHARRYVKRGLAQWSSPTSILMLDSHQRTSAIKTLRPIVHDGAGFAHVEAVQNLPCAGSAFKAFHGPRQESPANVIHTEPRVLASREFMQSF